MMQERYWGEWRDVTIIPMVVVDDAVGMGEVTLDEGQGGRAEHLRKRPGRLLQEGQVEEPAGETERLAREHQNDDMHRRQGKSVSRMGSGPHGKNLQRGHLKLGPSGVKRSVGGEAATLPAPLAETMGQETGKMAQEVR